MSALFYLLRFQTITEKAYLMWKLGSIKSSKYRFGSCTSTFDWYFSQLIVLLKTNFNSFALSRVDKVTTGIYSFVSVIENVFALSASQTTHRRSRLMSQLIKDILIVLQNYLNISIA